VKAVHLNLVSTSWAGAAMALSDKVHLGRKCRKVWKWRQIRTRKLVSEDRKLTCINIKMIRSSWKHMEREERFQRWILFPHIMYTGMNLKLCLTRKVLECRIDCKQIRMLMLAMTSLWDQDNIISRHTERTWRCLRQVNQFKIWRCKTNRKQM
jgi:hypothetical protein